MAILHIYSVNVPEEEALLKKHSRPVEAVTPRIKTLLDDMYETMLDAAGVGLAAPQVGVLRRVVVIQIPDEKRINLINPVIVSKEGEQTGEEGCLSVPMLSGIVTRPMKVKVEALDENGQPVTVEGEGLLARALCHEIDHLDGVIYTDLATEMIKYLFEPEEPQDAEEPARRKKNRRKQH
ncbi:MAG: peptide deformylase [Clostridia bacterium]|nr:peptide deformylase [Clostridia bacterium]